MKKQYVSPTAELIKVADEIITDGNLDITSGDSSLM